MAVGSVRWDISPVIEVVSYGLHELERRQSQIYIANMSLDLDAMGYKMYEAWLVLKKIEQKTCSGWAGVGSEAGKLGNNQDKFCCEARRRLPAIRAPWHSYVEP